MFEIRKDYFKSFIVLFSWLLRMQRFFFLNFFDVMNYDTLEIFSIYFPYEGRVFEDYESMALFSLNIKEKMCNCS